MKTTQCRRIIDITKLYGNKIDTNELKKWAIMNAQPIGVPDRRMRELVAQENLREYDMPNHKMISRPLTNKEMKEKGYKKRVQCYEIMTEAQEARMIQTQMHDDYGFTEP